MGQIEQAEADPRRRAVGKHLAEPHAEEGGRPVGGDEQASERGAEQRQVLGQLVGVEAQRTRVVMALVERMFALEAEGAPGARHQARVLRRAVVQHGRRQFVGGLGCEQTALCERHTVGAGVGARPRRFGDPAAGAVGPARLGLRARLLPDAQHRPAVDAVVDVAQEAIPEAHRLLQEADRGARYAVVRVDVRPRPDQAQARARQAGHQAQHRVAVAVGPAADRPDRGLDCVEVLAHRAVPVGCENTAERNSRPCGTLRLGENGLHGRDLPAPAPDRIGFRVVEPAPG